MKIRKPTLVLCLAVLLLSACHRNRYDYIDFGASETAFRDLAAGFAAVPDSVPDGRRAYLLSQGVPVTDILFYAGEDPARAVPPPEVPYGYNADWIGTDALLDSLWARQGLLFDATGRTYRVLVLLNERMSAPVLAKVAGLADAGAVISGVRPAVLSGPGDTQAFWQTVDRVWRNGNVISGVTLGSALSAAGVIQDVKTRTDGLAFSHRSLPEGEIYRVVNLSEESCRAKLKFRVTGRQASLWNPANGDIRPLSYKIKAHKTKVFLPLEPGDDLFVVFGPRSERRKVKVQ